MIIRSLTLRHGRIALARPPLPLRTWRRTVTTETETAQTETVEAPVSNPFDRHQLPTTSVQSPPINAAGARFEIRDPDHPVAQELQFKHHLKTITNHVGNAVDPNHYKPHELITNPPYPSEITLELLMASQAHLGHSTALWHPSNAKYIFGIRGDQDPIHIISLDITATHLRRACRIVQGVAERGGLILFVGTRHGQARAVVKAARLSKGYHLFSKWIPGTITNGQQILANCQKKVVDDFDNEIPGFEAQLHDQAVIKPDLVVCLNPLENYVLLQECGMNNIPTIGVVDTDCNPTWVTYPIPANDDSLRCISVIAGTLGRAGQLGQAARLKATQRGRRPARRPHTLMSPDSYAEENKGARKVATVDESEFAELDEAEFGGMEVQEFMPVEEAVEEVVDLGAVDPSLIGDALSVLETSEPYEVDQRLDAGAEQSQTSDATAEGDLPEETATEAELRQMLEDAVKQQEADEKKP